MHTRTADRSAARGSVACASLVVCALSALVAFAWSTLSAPAALADSAVPAFVVIVHPTSKVTSLDRRFIGDAFLKKTTRWDDGEAILPVDLAPGSGVRRQFSEDVIGRSVASVKSHWQQIIFSGRGLPPPELADDDAVVRYVVSHPGAIGYVSGAGAIGDARVVQVR